MAAACPHPQCKPVALMWRLVEASAADVASLASWLPNLDGISWSREQLADSIARPEYQLRVVKAASLTASKSPVDPDRQESRQDAAGFLLAQFIDTDANLIVMATSPAKRRAGLAKILLEDFSVQARQRACTQLLLEVRESNRAAINLYRQFGFGEQARRPGYYPATANKDKREAAILMQCPLVQ